MGRMMRVVTVAAVLAGVGSSNAAAQRAFDVGATDFGPVVGLGGIGGAGLSFGARFERAIKAVPDLGDGVLAISFGVDYYSFSSGSGTNKFKFSYIPIGATLNYHIKAGDKIDPFVGLGLGYSIASGSGFGTGVSGSALYFIGRAGVRYYLANGVALYGEVGAGAATINLGAMFRIAGKK